jgi:hypothetical protein
MTLACRGGVLALFQSASPRGPVHKPNRKLCISWRKRKWLLQPAGGRVEGRVTCGDVEVEKGAVLAGGIFSSYDRGEVKPVNDNAPAARRGGEAPATGASRITVDAAE